MSATGRLWLLAASLSLVLAAEIAGAPTRESPAHGVAPLPAPAPSSPPSVPPQARAKALADDTETILARPLFAVSRRPFPTAPPPSAVAPPRLTGVIIAPGARLALFASGEGKVTAVANGHSIGGYMVRAISLNEVIVSGPGGRHALHVSFVHVTPHVIQPVQIAEQ